ncbi:MAG: RNA 2',3'-cyclic phosphodiesterase [Pseudodesulfovibrio sp.]
MPRLFVGVPVDPACRDALARLTAWLAERAGEGVRWTRPENFHLTFQFLGETPQDRIAPVAEALAAIRFAPFTLRPGPMDCLPHCRRPRVLHLTLARGGPDCAALAARVRTAMDPFGYPRGSTFTPHLTLGRVKRPGPIDPQALAASPGGLPAFLVDRFILWQSELTPAGPIHTAVREMPATDAAS